MSRVERHAAEEAAKRGKRYKTDKPEPAVKEAAEQPSLAVTESAEQPVEIQAERTGRVARQSAYAAAGKDAGKTNKAKNSAKAEKKERKTKQKKPPMTFMGRLLNLIGTLLMLATLIVCLGLIVPRYFGINSYIVVSGSMEPSVPVGSMIFSKEVDPVVLQPGEIIVFNSTRMNDSPITHRIVENNTEKGEIITKGDANEQNDIQPVTYDNVIGKVVRHIPDLGYIASPLSSLMGKIAVGMIFVAGFLLTEVGVRLRKKPKKR